ncbi:MAG: hypothetical protein ACRCU2_31840 [Planktothrix sp.]
MSEQENNQDSPPRINKKIKKRRESKNHIDEGQYSTFETGNIPVPDNEYKEARNYNREYGNFNKTTHSTNNTQFPRLDLCSLIRIIAVLLAAWSVLHNT